jgi:hypothetical protein
VEFDVERMCRLNGKRPTARERWTAFYRLYRISQGHGVYQDMAAADCLRVLMPSGRCIALMNEGDRSPSRTHIPVFLRRKLVDADRRRRLYGKHPEWMGRDKVVAAKVREDGIEVTPEQVGEVRQKVLRLARQRAAECGIPVPGDDAKLLDLLHDSLRGKEEG